MVPKSKPVKMTKIGVKDFNMEINIKDEQKKMKQMIRKKWDHSGIGSN